MENEISNEELRNLIIDEIKTVYDPEIPINVWDLGLIYDIQITETKEVVVLMTLTAPNCPEAMSIPREVEETLKEMPQISKAKVIITFDPPWDRSRISEAALLELGLL